MLGEAGIVGEGAALQVRIPGLELPLCHEPAVCLWVNHFLSLAASSSINKRFRQR